MNSNGLKQEEKKFINYLQYWNDYEWQNHFFKMIEKVIELYNGNFNETQLAFQFYEADHRLDVQINNRSVLYSQKLRNEKRIGLILPRKFNKFDYKNILSSQPPYEYKNGGIIDAYLVRFKINEVNDIDKNLINLWEEAIKNEIAKNGKNSPNMLKKIELQALITELLKNPLKKTALFEYAQIEATKLNNLI